MREGGCADSFDQLGKKAMDLGLERRSPSSACFFQFRPWIFRKENPLSLLAKSKAGVFIIWASIFDEAGSDSLCGMMVTLMLS